MSKRKDAADSKSESAAQSDAKAQAGNDLPSIASPSIFPADDSIDSGEPGLVTDDSSQAHAAADKSRSAPSARGGRSALLAASVIFAAAFGAVIGTTANTYLARSAKIETAAVAEHEATQRTVGQLLKQMTVINAANIEAAGKAQREIAALKASLDSASKSTTAQLSKVAERLDRVEQQAKLAAPETTGSIKSHHGAAGAKASSEDPAIVRGWVVHATRNGLIYVEGRGGIYRVVPGVSVPGLGAVETIKREDGRWMVVTPRGTIVSMRDRPYFRPY